MIRGFGHVKLASVDQASKQRSELLAAMLKVEQGVPQPASPHRPLGREEAVV